MLSPIPIPSKSSFTTSGSASGKIISLDTNTQVLKLEDVTGTINLEDTITSQTGGTSIVKRFNLAAASVDVVPVTDTDGEFILGSLETPGTWPLYGKIDEVSIWNVSFSDNQINKFKDHMAEIFGLM